LPEGSLLNLEGWISGTGTGGKGGKVTEGVGNGCNGRGSAAGTSKFFGTWSTLRFATGNAGRSGSSLMSLPNAAAMFSKAFRKAFVAAFCKVFCGFGASSSSSSASVLFGVW
jgi:hypothetical protein